MHRSRHRVVDPVCHLSPVLVLVPAMVRVHLPVLPLGLLPNQLPSKSLRGVPSVLPVRTLDQVSGLLYD
jgi:hypothetical protein